MPEIKVHQIQTDPVILKRKRKYTMPEYKTVYINERFRPERSLKEFIAFDTETTGLDPEKDRIIQLSAVRFKDMKPCETWNTYLNPGCPLSPEAAAVNGITEDMVKDAPAIEEVTSDFLNFIGKCPVAGYNVGFDLAFLWCSGIDLIASRRIYDAMLSAYGPFPKGSLADRKLVTLAAYYGIEFRAHDSLGDSIAAGEALLKIADDVIHGRVHREP